MSPDTSATCVYCGKTIRLTITRHLRIHGPRNSPCKGSLAPQEGRPCVEDQS